MSKTRTKHIIIDARIRRASTGRPVDRLLEHLQQLDKTNRYTVLLEPGDDWQPQSKRFETAACKYKQFSFNPLQQILFARFLYKLRPDLVHFTMTGQQPLFYFGPQITFTHDLTMLRYARRGRLPKLVHSLRMKGYRLLLWSAHKQAKRVLVPTEYVKDAVHKYHLFTGRKLVVTLEASEPPLPVKAELPKVLKSDLGLQTSNLKFVLYVGSAFPHKNLRRLVKAFEMIRQKRPGMKLVLVGKQEYHSKKLERWVRRLDYGEDIIFTGFVSDAELKWLYENAAAYAFPSLSEGFGLPGLEAMVHGCPVVSSDSTCLPEVYGEAAHYFDPCDTGGMADAILKIINSEKFRKDLVRKGHAQTRKFSWRRMAEQTLIVYNEVL